MKLLFSIPLFLLATLFYLSSGTATKVHAAVGPVPVQDAAQDASTTPNISGNWQLAWTARNGNERQAAMHVKQDGNKLSGKFEGERGSAALTGNLQGTQISLNLKMRGQQVTFTGTVDGDKMSGTTERGAQWTAMRQ